MVFLVHPLHVESVAWIAQRKDVLSGCFYLLGILCYLHTETRGRSAFLAALTCCALALMAKPMAVTLPLVLILLDASVYRRPLFASVVQKWPMWLLCLGVGLLTLKAQGDGGAMSGLDIHSLEMRLSTVVWGYATYLRQFLLPVELAAFYPLREQHSIVALAAATLAIAALLVTALRLRRSEPLVALGIGFFFVTLLPVIGVLQVGVQAHADRYMYLPLLGLLIALMPPLCRFFTQRTRLVASLAVIAIAFLSLLAYWQVGYWQNRGTLFSRALSVNGPLYLAHLKLADEFNDRGDQETALMHALNALELEPDRAYAQIALGDIALARSDLQSAQRYYMEAVSMSQENSFLLNKIGVLWARQGRIGDALGLFQRALELSPEYYPARQNLELYAPVLPGLDRN
jgi:tetratricopeptide (TPR) repeat protein